MKPKLEFTGERLIPSLNKGAAFFYEHLCRYLFASQVAEKKSILDLGSGEGYGTYILYKEGGAKEATGVDLSTKSIAYSKEKYRHPKLHFYVGDVTKLNVIHQLKTYDLITCYEVIEHIREQDSLLKGVKKLLTTNGIFFVSTPNKYLYPTGNPYHVKELYPHEFKKLLMRYFKHIEFFDQKFEFSQVIKNSSNLERFTLEETFLKRSQTVYAKEAKKISGDYIVAVCSNKQLPSLLPTTANTFKVDNLDMSQGIIQLENQTYQENKRIQELQTELKNAYEIIRTIKNSKFFHLWQKYCSFRDSLMKGK